MARYLNDLDSASSVVDADILLVQQEGVDKKVTLNSVVVDMKLVKATSDTSFPGSPNFADECYRTDLDEWYKFNGDVWIQI